MTLPADMEYKPFQFNGLGHKNPHEFRGGHRGGDNLLQTAPSNGQPTIWRMSEVFSGVSERILSLILYTSKNNRRFDRIPIPDILNAAHLPPTVAACSAAN